jgi:hypothetical protein
MDELGNRMNADGRAGPSVKVIPVGYCREYKMNNAFLVRSRKHLLDANKNFASVKFSMIHTPMDTKAR